MNVKVLAVKSVDARMALVTLSDGRVFRAGLSFKDTIQHWQPGDPVVHSDHGGNFTHKHTLTNLSHGETVNVMPSLVDDLKARWAME